MKKVLYLAIFISLFISCNPVRRILNTGNLRQTEFIEKIPFNFDFGVPIIKVNIGNKSYNFLFDTGAPTTLSPELARTLNLKSLQKSKNSDSQGYEKKEDVVIIPEIKIGNLIFENTGALIIDMKKTFQMACLNVDGIIGANQMSKAIWQLDYKNKIITATNNLSNFEIPKDVKTIDFLPVKIQNTPLIPVTVNSKTTYITFDTGSNGDLNLGLTGYLDAVKNLKKAESVGIGGTGVYGEGRESVTTYIKVPEMQIGTLKLINQIVPFRNGKSGNIGNGILQHYKVIIDWNMHKIYLPEVSNFDFSKLNRFGIGLKFIENKTVIASIFKNTDAEQLGMAVNDEIVEIDGRNVSNFTEADACYFTFTNIFRGKDSSKVTISKNGRKINFNLKRAILLE
ncbi:hypothetical protein DU508_18415 [Pedobacter chinensis]|uniref:PDZ domain-containing protein n=1 Tax=Pedobacter chinensis TaxID=2282421 RepID=A0A369PV55_9SPHI|nr:aspartyl protease family protein [Pedobacter chinensis]RDC55125.1 hypothetical protein DU508_18415 [Pedobacter chinensis]